MPSKDISRYLFQPEKGYVGARMQQGRVITDDDLNAHRRLHSEDARRTLAEIICSKGTPNDGFRIGNVTTEDYYDFPISDGSFYLGGLRFEIGKDETLLNQKDWLQIDAVRDIPARPKTEASHLVYLRAWEQCVSAVEDSELIEHALGGPDTSVFVRRMRRVEVFVLSDGFQGGCAEAFKELTDFFKPAARIDPNSCELRSNVTLTVGFRKKPTEDPCQPQVTQGFIGAENQAIRVQLTAPGRFVWGFDNASPLYRVQIVDAPGDNGQRRGIKFLTQPRDQLSQPTTEHVVEILPWGALLPNGEKVAEHLQRSLVSHPKDASTHFTRVKTSFDPETESLTIVEAVPQEWTTWLNDHSKFRSQRDAAKEASYFYLRVWSGGPPANGASPDHTFDTSRKIPLVGTGLTLHFSQMGQPGDYWIIAARPNTPDNLVPWDLLEAAPPAGPRQFFAPLALIEWNGIANQPTVRDCRTKFRPLCAIKGCCTLTVGDGVSSHGEFDSIQEAVEHLPGEGGEICLLPGLHRANVKIRGGRDIRIKGCDKQTRVAPQAGNPQTPVFTIVDSTCVSIEHIDVVSFGGTGFALEQTKDGVLDEILIAHNRILSCEHAIRINDGSRIHVYWNRIRILDKAEGREAILIFAKDSLIERNDIGVHPAPPELPGEPPPREERDPADPCAEPEVYLGSRFLLDKLLVTTFRPLPNFQVLVATLVRPYRALGGIRIAARSEGIKVLENRIVGGTGNGVTLGGPPRGVVVDAEPGVEVPDLSIRHDSDQIFARVTGSGSDEGGQSFRFAQVDGQRSIHSAQTGTSEDILLTAETGRYQVEALSPGLRITAINTRNLDEFGVIHEIAVERLEPPINPDLGFIYDTVIEANEILAMGLSGIGSPLTSGGSVIGTRSRVASSFASRPPNSPVGNPVIGAAIIGNDIRACLRRLDDDLRSLSQTHGLGGISLHFASSLTIAENTIEGNGRNQPDPVCGIFVGVGDQLEIHRNEVIDNGAIGERLSSDRVGGIRGGIVAGVAQGLFPDAGRLGFSRDAAARIHDNLVRHPVGHALLLGGVGPMSINANRFHSLRSAPGRLGSLAATVFLSNRGGGEGLPSGCTNFNGNQVLGGADAGSFVNVGILTLDDLGFDANQVETLNKSVQVNAMLVGNSLRASDSRFKEPKSDRKDRSGFCVSLLSSTTTMNNTVNNQGDHCIYAMSDQQGRVREEFNQALVDSSVCEENELTIKRLFDRFMADRTGAAALIGRDALKSTRPTTVVDENGKILQASYSAQLAELNSLETQLASALVQVEAETRALTQHETVRLSMQRGGQERRLASFQAHLSERLAAASALSVNAEFADIKIALVEEEGMRIHGRIADANDRGIGRLLTCLVDAEGTAVTGTELRITSSTGYFAHVFDAGKVDELSGAHPDGAQLGIFSHRGRPLFSTQDLFLFKAGGRETANVRLDRNRGFEVIDPVKPGPTPEPKPITVNVPNVVGTAEAGPISVGEARKVLNKVGLQVGTVAPADAPHDSTVVAQAPRPGTQVPAGTSIDLKVRPPSPQSETSASRPS